MAMAIHTPFNPYCGANIAANVSRTHHMDNKFMMAGFKVSPAPTHTLYVTMAAAKNGSANASIRKL